MLRREGKESFMDHFSSMQQSTAREVLFFFLIFLFLIVLPGVCSTGDVRAGLLRTRTCTRPQARNLRTGLSRTHVPLRLVAHGVSLAHYRNAQTDVVRGAHLACGADRLRRTRLTLIGKAYRRFPQGLPCLRSKACTKAFSVSQRKRSPEGLMSSNHQET